MDITWLEDFLALAEYGGFSKAAENRAVSQSSFSRRIQSLEHWVGAPLFNRDTHNIHLTPAGEKFFLTAEDTVRLLKLGREEALAVADATSNTLKFASTHALSLTFFPGFLRDLETHSPSAPAIELSANSMEACEKLMTEGKAHFLLCHHNSDAPVRFSQGFQSLTIGQDTLIPVASKSLLQNNDDTTPHLAFTSESGMGRIINAARHKKRLPPLPHPVFSSHLASVLTAMALEGRGVAWLPLTLVHDHIADGSLVKLHAGKEDINIEIRLWRPKARQAPVAEEFWKKAKIHTATTDA